MRIRSAPVAALAALVALAGCEKPAQDRAPPPQFLGSDSTCRRPSDRPQTRPFHTITVEGDSIIDVKPESVAQPPRAGIVGWRSPDYFWRVTYKGGESPLDDSTFTGQPGELVWAGIRDDAACKYYDFEVQVWGEGLGDTLSLDPGDFVIPYSYSEG